MAEFPLLVTHRGRGSRGVDVVSDGALLLAASLLSSVALAPRCVEVTAASIDALLDGPVDRWSPLSSLRPSERRVGVFWTPSDRALAGRYLSLFHQLGPGLELGTAGPLDPIVLRLDGATVGALMPLDVRSEREPLAPVGEGLVRGHLHGVSGGQGAALLRLGDGRDLPVAAACSLDRLRGGDLLDAEAAADASGALRVVAAWPAGDERPRPGAARAPLERSLPLRPVVDPSLVTAMLAPRATEPAPRPKPAHPHPEAVRTGPRDYVLHLERFDPDARRIVSRAQALADARRHVNLEPLHLAIELVRADVEPRRAKLALSIGDRLLARLPTAPGHERSYLSLVTQDLLAEADRMAEGRPVTCADLWDAIRRRRGSTGASVLEATFD